MSSDEVDVGGAEEDGSWKGTDGALAAAEVVMMEGEVVSSTDKVDACSGTDGTSKASDEEGRVEVVA